MLKKTLEKNHVKNVKNDLQTNNYQKYLEKRKRKFKKLSEGL